MREKGRLPLLLYYSMLFGMEPIPSTVQQKRWSCHGRHLSSSDSNTYLKFSNDILINYFSTGHKQEHRPIILHYTVDVLLIRHQFSCLFFNSKNCIFFRIKMLEHWQLPGVFHQGIDVIPTVHFTF
jgi:hypothetical protein